MNTAASSITVSTSLSIILHGAAIIAIYLASEQIVPTQAVGNGVRVELISSVEVSEQLETDSPDNLQIKNQSNISDLPAIARVKSGSEHSRYTGGPEMTENKKIIDDPLLDDPLDEPVLSVDKSNTVIAQAKGNNVPVTVVARNAKNQQKEVEQRLDKVYQENNQAEAVRSTIARSTNASQQYHSLLELLHSRISNKKVYPYLAKRQRREGTSTVEFILHPDGSIESVQLLNSSRTELLDRAAISAVRDIEPFEAAPEYLEQAESFQVDVVFSLL